MRFWRTERSASTRLTCAAIRPPSGQYLEVLIGQEMQIPRQQEVIFRLACRTARDLQETVDLTIGSSAAVFGDVRPN
jgi:hypothetical protein